MKSRNVFLTGKVRLRSTVPIWLSAYGIRCIFSLSEWWIYFLTRQSVIAAFTKRAPALTRSAFTANQRMTTRK